VAGEGIVRIGKESWIAVMARALFYGACMGALVGGPGVRCAVRIRVRDRARPDAGGGQGILPSAPAARAAQRGYVVTGRKCFVARRVFRLK
jgi:hypothetical protein